LTTLTNGINRYPDYLDLYVYRAKINEEQGNFENAQEDYEFVLKKKKDNA
jgi:Tfp pilus assembly protein PilF